MCGCFLAFLVICLNIEMKTQDSPVQKALKLALIFVIQYFIATVAAGIIYMVYVLCTSYVAGDTFSTFNWELFVFGMFLSSFLVTLLNGMFLIFYLIRHPFSPVVSVITYVILSLVAWLVISPASCYMLLRQSSNMMGSRHEVILSPGYFRTVDDAVVYYTAVTPENVGNGVIIAKNESEEQVFPFSQEHLSSSTGTFADSLIQSSIDIPYFFVYALFGIRMMHRTAMECVSQGFFAWLSFASLGAALISLIGLRRVSSWRLVNVNFVLLFTILIISFNMFYYGSNFFDFAVNKFTTFFGDRIPNIFLVVCNLLICLIFSIIGIVVDVTHKEETQWTEE